MEEITLELETVTPLFIAGADWRNIENVIVSLMPYNKLTSVHTH